MPGPPELSVLIPTLDYPQVDRVLGVLLEQDHPPGSYEVILADWRDGVWKARLAEEAARNPAVVVTYLQLDSDQMHRTRLLNAAIRASRGQVLVFLAGDFTPEANFIGAHLRFHEQHPDTEAVAVGPNGFVAEQAQGPLVRWLEESGRLFGFRMGEGDAGGLFYVGNASMKRALLDRVGEFDEAICFNAMDDFELGHRLRAAGMRSYYLPEAVTHHEHPHEINLADFRKAMRMLGESAVVFEAKHPGPYEWTATCQRSPLSLRIDAVFWRMRYTLTRRREYYLHRHYMSTQATAFVEGWRSGRRRRHPAAP